MAQNARLVMLDKSPQQICEHVFRLSAIFKVAPALWIPVSMTIIRNPDDQTLILYSPLNPTLYTDLSSLGTVTAIVAPSGMHSMYPQTAQTHYPSAKLFSAPTLQTRFPNLNWGTLVTAETPEDILGSHVRVRLASSCPFMAEIVLLHEASQTLIVSDLAFNFTQEALTHASWLARLYIKATGAADRPLDVSKPLRAMIRPHCARALIELDSLLEWPWTRVIPCHGDVVENAKPKFIAGIYKFVKETAAKQRESATRGSNYNPRRIFIAVALVLLVTGLVWRLYVRE